MISLSSVAIGLAKYDCYDPKRIATGFACGCVLIDFRERLTARLVEGNGCTHVLPLSSVFVSNGLF